ncbi:hypothetical protein SIPHO016v1_p0014 [Vibrio phage 38E33.6a]|nr:hypothetical protein SIPHO017v1_p0001 [Vibrio phage 19E33.1]QZI92793.1 hypothetical protein SIPHO016v1_p0014 [Vibrio phage 38E33.6a]QZI92981.1 hypothetical protein SIPHO015v1_p0043 [Vibrio phage 82E32.2]QZI93000.1 hypothetical protein SIPHO014v1_p0001 [Vibrio phage 82E32.3]QZI93109.1 hypothetical protein SIPHO013v1_p0048 [Vibrio phage 82E33.2]
MSVVYFEGLTTMLNGYNVIDHSSGCGSLMLSAMLTVWIQFNPNGSNTAPLWSVIDILTIDVMML